MKNLMVLILALFLAACGQSGGSSGGSGGGGGSDSAPVDLTPHDYEVTAHALVNQANPHLVTLHQICNLGMEGFRDNLIEDFNLQAPQTNVGMGCADVSKFDFYITNDSVDVIHLDVRVDGVSQFPGGREIQPNETFNFRRGY